MKRLKAIIVEDEEPARILLKKYLEEYNQIEVVAECRDGFEGVKKISEMKPDIVFLDIQMPKLTGFEMLEVLDNIPEIIFTTAYDQFAIKAFEFNAVDYLLKPFHKDRFREAIQKSIEKIGTDESKDKITGMIQSGKQEPDVPLTRVVVRKGNSINLIQVSQIKYIEAQDDYVMFYHNAGKALKHQTMKFYEENLPESDFIRIHRSYIVRVEEIKRIEPYEKDSHVAILQSGDRLPVSRSGYRHLKDKLGF